MHLSGLHFFSLNIFSTFSCVLVSQLYGERSVTAVVVCMRLSQSGTILVPILAFSLGSDHFTENDTNESHTMTSPKSHIFFIFVELSSFPIDWNF